MDDAVRVPTVFTKNRKRLIKHDAMIEFFNEVQAIAEKKVWLSGEHFSMDGTPIQARAGHKSFVRKADNQNNGDGGNFKGSKRSNETHQSKTDPDSRLYRKGNNTGSELRYIGHTLGDNRHGLIVNAMVIKADGYAEREAARAMINDARQALDCPRREITLGADKGDDAVEFVQACQSMNVTPHVAQNKSARNSAVPESIAQSTGYAISQPKPKLIEQRFGWAKFVGGIRQVMECDLKKVDHMFVTNMASLQLSAHAHFGRNLFASGAIMEKRQEMS